MYSHIKSSALLLMVSLMAVGAGCQTPTQLKEFSDWPEGASPQEVGKRVAENFLTRKFDYETNPRRVTHIYPEVCAWYGSLTVAQLTKDSDLSSRLIKKFEMLLTPEGTNRLPVRAHVDDHVFGALPFEIYLQNKDPRCLEFGKRYADPQWEKTTGDGITTEARYWSDDMFMITAVQVQAYRATGDIKYMDRSALTMAAYLDKLQQTNGLFFHGTDAQFYWGRGNGWVAAGMAELLRSIPKDHPKRARIMEGYKKMMESLLKYQSEEGLWRQLIDQPDFWLETSGTGMFTFAMVTGVKNGWLDETTYGPAARKAWLGLVKYVDKDAKVTEVCVGTNKGTSLQYYKDRTRSTGDLHGQAPVLWTASALLR